MASGGGGHSSLCRNGHCRPHDCFYGEGASEDLMCVCVPVYGGGDSAVERQLQSLHSAWPGEAWSQGRVVFILETARLAHSEGVRGKSRGCPESLERRCPRGASSHYSLIHH